MKQPPQLDMAPNPAFQTTVYGMQALADRAAAVNEVHARPHLLIQAPRGLLQLAFITEGDSAKDQAAMTELSQRLGVAEPDNTTPLHGLTWDEGDLHCEKHTEFSTYLWSAVLDPETGAPCGENPFKRGFVPPGPVISGIRLNVLPWTEAAEQEIERFDPVSLCYSVVENGAAAIVTDFRQDADGLTNILILDRDLTQARAGALAQRLLEIETYRTLALLALPLTRSLTVDLRRMESQLAAITDEMRTGKGARRDNDVLLAELTSLGAELEAGVAANLYRFGASRAYYEIVEERLDALAEESVAGYCTWRDFLHRRIAPAMRTCQSVKERQTKLSDKLTRAIALLRSWIDVELERQNRDLLESMNNRAKLQLRLQQTVEGLSVAAISYYVVSLLAYLLKGIPGVHDKVAPELVIAGLVPVVILAIWWTVRRIRHAHGDHAGEEKSS
ncbi:MULTISPECIES: DUF3422 family protein [Pseudomonadaceae]|jgi:uncharacterized membrane-anchored protein|uniref:DUF3422 family protein n=5 Tax=Pseudomonas TaxID=286 RepID=A0A7W2L682_PSEPU|nr:MULTISPECIES: DUF3422 family protein [Pseudomonadaceae]EIU5536939.1 DUF3422 family protein [Pseudomonas aeruginosa]MBA6119061.1 DUF3422 family protein [Pseudomonas putida]MBF4560444.1 DUF3422 family protein [Pseudomonas sp. p50(2008)]MBF6043576.1 DUF3422 family protein [Pseudomonas mucoides]MBK3915754.1 DUF3422 family protein [Stutzerimonas frequens]|tara:strand:- start:2947 stop:4284 length:1338 start_codon:yes stop_codon:yes gene_type:complete